MRILVATDAWHPQVNGVVQTYDRLREPLGRLNVQLAFLSPSDFASVPCPIYPDIQLALSRRAPLERMIAAAGAEHIHIATEGPIGWRARRYCRDRALPFTTSYHTRFPEYLDRLARVPASWTRAALRSFHNASAGVMVATASLRRELAGQGFERLQPWTRGVDTTMFRPGGYAPSGEGPVFLHVGRVSKEKNIEAFLDARLPGRKVVVGEGPHRAALARRYPEVTFTGLLRGEALAAAYASANVFVFPSRTDTFGLVLLEAMACGVPVAAYPVTGPVDVVDDGVSGILDEDIAAAAIAALELSREAVRASAERFSWPETARMFLDNVVAAHSGGRRPQQTLSSGRVERSGWPGAS